MSWHCLVALWRDETGDIKKKTCFYLMGHIKQDWFASLSNVESFIVYLKEGVLHWVCKPVQDHHGDVNAKYVLNFG